MIAVDTNVLLRYLLHDDEAQAARADAVFDAAETVLIADVVLVEAVWTLAGRKYRLAEAELVAVLERLFSERNVRFEDDRVVWRALQAYKSAARAGEAGLAQGAGFADALIVFKALRAASDAGEALTGVDTFDEAMRRLAAHRIAVKPIRRRPASADASSTRSPWSGRPRIFGAVGNGRKVGGGPGRPSIRGCAATQGEEYPLVPSRRPSAVSRDPWVRCGDFTRR